MSPALSTLGWGLGLVLGMLGLHLLRWKLALPKNQLGTLLKLILAIAALWVLAHALPWLLGLRLGPLPLGPVSALMALLFYIGLSFAYTVLFTTIDADSPSITMLQALHAAGPEGLSEDELTRRTGMDRFFASRIERMVDDGLAKDTPAGLVPGSKGLGLLRLVLFWRVVMGASKDLAG